MEQIKKAIARARDIRETTGLRGSSDGAAPLPLAAARSARPATARPPDVSGSQLDESRFQYFRLDEAYLESQRIIAYQGGNPMSVGFDMLRTKVQQDMRDNGMRTVLVTSPTAGCGKTVTSINLAMSMARQQDNRSILVDFDFRRPQIATDLGIKPSVGVNDLIAGNVNIEEAMLTTDLAGPRMAILPCRAPISHPSEVLSSPVVQELVERLKSDSSNATVIFDMPPMMVADDVLAFLPFVDAMIMIVAAGQTKAHEIESCQRNLPEDKFLGMVLTKSDEAGGDYYYYY